MRRREFIALASGAAAWPHSAFTQERVLPLVGILGSTSANGYGSFIGAFHRGLKTAGFVEGVNVTVEYRWAEGRYDRLPALATDLVRRRVNVIATIGGTPSALAATEATSTIPIVFVMSADPLTLGLVTSLNNPRRNATGIEIYILELEAKKVQLISQLVPEAAILALLVNPSSPIAKSQAREASAAVRTLGRQLQILNATGEHDFELAFKALVTTRSSALIVGADSVFLTHRVRLVALAAHYAVPAIWSLREYVVSGGLISYGDNLSDAYREAGVYTGRILKGANPSVLPIRRPNKFELVINLTTARALGLSVPPPLLLRADELVE